MARLLRTRLLTARFIFIGATVLFLFGLHRLLFAGLPLDISSYTLSRPSCPPRAYSAGRWDRRPKTNETVMTKPEDALAFAGLGGCASSREYFWHLAADREDQWDRFPRAQSWEWTPGKGCNISPLNSELLLKHLVEQGGWLLVGDSVTENHFFSLSCLLFPHVFATPDYVANPYFERDWIQNIYLSASSPLLSPSHPNPLVLPEGFNVAVTPLVTFRRVDLLFSQPDLVDLHQSLHNPAEDFTLFSDERTWTLSPSEYMDMLTAPLPQANYGTLVINTGGHWNTHLFSGYSDEGNEETKEGMEALQRFFREAMGKWADEVQSVLNHDKRTADGGVKTSAGQVAERQVVVRAYLPGHEDCHAAREPWSEIQPFVWGWYNWPYIRDFNKIFEGLLSSPAYPDIHFLDIDRPARLRPDAHTTGDCLHIMTGAGVLEGWSHYIWHFVSSELGAPVPSRYSKD